MGADGNRGDSGWWARLWRPRRWWLLGIPLGGFAMFVIGIGVWLAFTGFVHTTNSLGFCTSCHEMRDTVYQEYRKTVHYQNAAGVRAICSDCHVAKALGPKLLDKVRATFRDIPAHLMGTIDTKEKFEKLRPTLAKDVWASMKANDSQNCRSCHSYEAMARDAQSHSASKKHSPEWRKRFGDTCIDCHFGIAHNVPEGVTPKDVSAKAGTAGD